MTKAYLGLAAVMISSISLTGCDFVYGINSQKLVLQNADEQCITDALRQTPGVKDVKTETVANESWLIAGPGPAHGTPIRYFTYDIGTGFYPTLMVEDYGSRGFMFSDTMLSMNKKIPQLEIDKALPIMLDAEKQVSRTCGVEIDTGMKHTCDGSRCGP